MKITMKKINDSLTPSLKKKLQQAKDPTPALEAMGLTIVSMAQRAFTQAALRPHPWEPLAGKTLRAKEKRGYGSKPLIASGALSQSPRIIKVTKRSVTVGSDRRVGSHSLASIHQLGTKDGVIPARPFFPFSPDGRPTERAKKNMLSAADRALQLGEK